MKNLMVTGRTIVATKCSFLIFKIIKINSSDHQMGAARQNAGKKL